MYRVYLGMGSNIGDRLKFLTQAVEEISAIAIIHSISSVYEADPVGMASEQLFYNLALSIDTHDRPPELLKKLKHIERKLGRRRSSHLRDREIDIDILLYRGWSYDDESVTVPHPHLMQRRFVLEPLNEIEPIAIHPVFGQTIATLLRHCRDHSTVVRTSHVINLMSYHEQGSPEILA